jgi:hypothetical protein
MLRSTQQQVAAPIFYDSDSTRPPGPGSGAGGAPAAYGSGRNLRKNGSCLPLTTGELGFDVDVEHILRFGLLPQIRSDPDFAVDTLDAYVSNYLREEIQQEALVRRLDTFARFLQVAALMNGRVSISPASHAMPPCHARPCRGISKR